MRARPPPLSPQIVFEDTIVVKDGMSHSVIDQRVVTRESPEREVSPETPRFMGTPTVPSSNGPATALERFPADGTLDFGHCTVN